MTEGIVVAFEVTVLDAVPVVLRAAEGVAVVVVFVVVVVVVAVVVLVLVEPYPMRLMMLRSGGCDDDAAAFARADCD